MYPEYSNNRHWCLWTSETVHGIFQTKGPTILNNRTLGKDPKQFTLHAKRSQKLSFFSPKKEARVQIEPGPFPLKISNATKPAPLLLSPSRVCQPFGPYFRSLLATFNAVIGKARASYRWVRLIHLAYSGEVYSDVLHIMLHEGITDNLIFLTIVNYCLVPTSIVRLA